MSTTPTVYFIDDSATMREVIKIAFRRESMNVVACASGITALSQMEQQAPDVVITDVIMPEKDGYEVCQGVKQHPRFGTVPVILMSGVVNRAVAEKAFAVKADELIRKPFQPQDLIGRVRHLLRPKPAQARETSTAAAISASAALSSIFQTPIATAPMQRPVATARPAVAAPPPVVVPAATPPRMPPTVAVPRQAPPALSRAAGPVQNPPATLQTAVENVPAAAPEPAPVTTSAVWAAPPPVSAAPAARHGNGNGSGLDHQKLKIEVLRLEGLVRKLQSELQAEREYSRALEEHIKTLQEAD